MANVKIVTDSNSGITQADAKGQLVEAGGLPLLRHQVAPDGDLRLRDRRPDHLRLGRAVRPGGGQRRQQRQRRRQEQESPAAPRALSAFLPVSHIDHPFSPKGNMFSVPSSPVHSQKQPKIYNS